MNDDEIDKLLATISAMQEFQSELEKVPVEQQIRDLLGRESGAAWYGCQIASYELPDGQVAHNAFMMTGRGLALQVVHEASDGSLVRVQPLVPVGALESAPDGSMAAIQEPYSDGNSCLDKILPALKSVAKIIEQSDQVKPRRKTLLLRQIAHAVRHLTDMLP